MKEKWSYLNKVGRLLLAGSLIGALIAGCGGGGSSGASGGTASLSGTAASGLPVANAPVSIKDKNGNSKSATTLADGTYSADVTNMTAPYLIKVGALYSVATASGTANVHPFTDMIVRNWYKVQGSDVDTAFTATGAMPTPPTAQDIATIEGVVRQVLATYMTGASVNPSSFNLITTPFNANHAGFDLVLDSLKVTQPTTAGGNVTIGVTGGGLTGTILTVSESTSLTTLTPPPAPVSDTAAPAAPGVITAARPGTAQVVLSWGAASDNIQVAGYKVYRNGTQVGITDQPFYIDGAANNGASDCYTVSAYDAAGNSSGQNTQVCALAITVAADVTAPSAPGSLTAVASSSSQIDLAWSASTDDVKVAGYRVMAGGAAIATLPATATSYSHTGLNATTQYSYTVVAIDTSGNATSSNQASATTSAKTDTSAPTAPSGITTTLVTDNRIDLTWTASTDNVGVAGYKVYSGSTLVGTSATASFSAVNLTANTQYCATIKAYDAAGNLSAASAQGCATTLAAGTSALVGTWFASSGDGTTYTFNADGSYTGWVSCAGCGPEQGTYTWNSSTGDLVGNDLTHNNLNQAFVATVSGNTMTIAPSAGGIFTFTRVTTPAQTFTEFALPANSLPFGITSGPDGNLWFGDMKTNSIGKMTTAGLVTKYTIPTTTAYNTTDCGNGSCPQTIISGPDGNMWFVEGNGNKIAKITTAGVFTEYPNTPGGWPQDLAVGLDGNIWFTDQGAAGGGDPAVGANGAIGMLNITNGIITKYPLTANTQANFITLGPDGAMWFTQSGGSNVVAKIDMTGVITEFPNTGGAFITRGPDNNLWVTVPGMGIGKLTTAGVQTMFNIPSASLNPFSITAAPDGNLWFSEVGGMWPNWTGGGMLGRITTSGVVTEFTLPASNETNTTNPTMGVLTVGSDGAIWFADPRSARVVRFQP